MENKVKLLIEIGLQRDEDNGDVSVVAFDVPSGVAERVCQEQDKCQLLSESGDLTMLLNAYAVINGYQCAWFISASMEENAECKVQNDILPAGRFRIIIADVDEEKIILNEEVVCICGAFTKLKNKSTGLCSVHDMVLSKYATDIAVKTAKGAEDAARKMKKGAKAVDRGSFFKMIKNLFKEREE